MRPVGPRASTRLLALVGHPVRRSRSPEMHNAALRARGIDAVYLALEVAPARADRVVEALRTLGVAGANLTVPFKEAAVGQVDSLHRSAQRAGSVNTLVMKAGRVRGYNTDGVGLLDHLRHLGRPQPRRAVVLGAGGTGRAVGAALLDQGAHVTLLNRTPERARGVVAAWGQGDAGPLTASAFAHAAATADLVVRCTGGAGDATRALDPGGFGGSTWVDVNYWDDDPPHRAALGDRFVGGLGMLAFQGARALSLWIDDPVPGAELLDTLEAAP